MRISMCWTIYKCSRTWTQIRNLQRKMAESDGKEDGEAHLQIRARWDPCQHGAGAKSTRARTAPQCAATSPSSSGASAAIPSATASAAAGAPDAPTTEQRASAKSAGECAQATAELSGAGERSTQAAQRAAKPRGRLVAPVQRSSSRGAVQGLAKRPAVSEASAAAATAT